MMARRGFPAWWCASKVDRMPLGPYMINTVVRIIGDREQDRSTGKWIRGPIGTAFYVRVNSEAGDGHYSYIVTAHHVIDPQPKPELVFPDPHTPGGLYPPQPTERADWLEPLGDKVDLAVLPFSRPHGFFVNQLELDKHILPSLPAPALLGMPFYYTGLLEPINRAMARSGTLGAISREKTSSTRTTTNTTATWAIAARIRGLAARLAFLRLRCPNW